MKGGESVSVMPLTVQGNLITKLVIRGTSWLGCFREAVALQRQNAICICYTVLREGWLL